MYHLVYHQGRFSRFFCTSSIVPGGFVPGGFPDGLSGKLAPRDVPDGFI